MDGTLQQLQKPDAIAYHGWGFDSYNWQPWKDWLEQQGCRFQAFDRGYFGTSTTPVFNPTASIKILLVHSFGLHLCPVEQIKQADVVLIFSSFREFHPPTNPARRRSQRIVSQMIAQFQIHPEQVWQTFQANCYQPQECPAISPAGMECDRLLSDLKDLNDAVLEKLPLSNTAQVIVFHGSGDRIVAPARGQELVESLPVAAQWVEFPDAGHALPFTHAQECWQVLEPLLTQWQDSPEKINHKAPNSGLSLPSFAPTPDAYKHHVATRFGNAAETYQSQATLQQQASDRLFSALDASQLGIPDGDILEIGCGTGFITRHLVQRFPQRRLLITDLASEMLEVCQAQLEREGRSPVEFRVMDGEALSVPDESCALIVGGFVIQWFQQPAQSVAKMLSKLKPGGILLLSYPTCHSFQEWRTMCDQAGVPCTANPLPSSECLQSVLPAQAKQYCFEESFCTTYPTVREFFRSLKSIGASWNQSGTQLPLGQMRRLIHHWERQSPDQIQVHYQVMFAAIQHPF